MIQEMKINFVELGKDNEDIKDELLKAIEGVLVSGKFILSEETRKFEENFARIIGTKYAIGVNSGTDALLLSMKALGIGKGDEVIVPANSFIASATSVALAGATPVFIDVKENYLIDEEKIEELVTKKTKAVMPVHLTGRPCDMEKISNIAEKHSLHPLKNLSACGDGGVITTNDEELYNKLLQLRNIGLKNRNEADILGYNSRLGSLQAAILNVKLKYLDDITKKRRKNASLYCQILEEKKIKEVRYIPADMKKEFAVYHTFIIQAEKRDELMKYLRNRGIETAIHYPIP